MQTYSERKRKRKKDKDKERERNKEEGEREFGIRELESEENAKHRKKDKTKSKRQGREGAMDLGPWPFVPIPMLGPTPAQGRDRRVGDQVGDGLALVRIHLFM